jgi:antirestriction protein ArdC
MAKRKKKTTSKWDPMEHISGKIIEGMKQDPPIGPWTCPWARKFLGYTFGLRNVCDGSRAFNPITGGGRSYNGINNWTLSIHSQVHGFTDPRYCTHNQMSKKDWKIKEGQSGWEGGPGPADVFFWLVTDYTKKDEETGEIKTFKSFTIRVYKVWNFDQLEGPEPWESTGEDTAPVPAEPVVPEEGMSQEEAEARAMYALALEVVDAWKTEVPIKDGGDRAYYSPHGDFIQMPTFEQFLEKAQASGESVKDKLRDWLEALAFYLGTTFHEMVHSTGHKSREERDFSGRFGNEAYAFEELIAEIGAASLLAATGVVSTGEVREDHVAYIKSWIKVLENDHKAIFTAESQSKKAVTRILDHAQDAGVLPSPGDEEKPKPKAKRKSKAKPKGKGKGKAKSKAA